MSSTAQEMRETDKKSPGAIAALGEDNVVEQSHLEDYEDGKPYINADGEEDSPYAVVRATVSNKDDTTLPTLTFRFWIIAVPFSIAVSFFNQLFWFRTYQIAISATIIQLITLPIGRGLERLLPDKKIGFGSFRFSLNPGPFNGKEHGLILVCVSAATSVAYAVDIFVIKKAFYKQDTAVIGTILLVVTTQCIGYGLAGVCHKYLVKPAAMIWPQQLVSVALLRTFHEEDDNANGRITRWRFFLTVTACSACYYFLPGFIAPLLSNISILCLAMPDNKIAATVGSYTRGMGLLSFSLDWNALVNAALSPLMMPFWSIVNIIIGFALYVWVLTPIGYFGNIWDAQNFGLFGSALYTPDGEPYPTKSLLKDDLSLDEEKYQEIGAPRMGFMFAIGYGIGFAGLTSAVVHIILYYGKDIIRRYRESRGAVDDVHSRLMTHYPAVPQWWYLLTLAVSIALSIFTCEYYGTNLPWWGLLLAVAMAAFFLLPIGIITAVSNQTPGLNIITEFVIGFILPGEPIANVTFKTYGYIGMYQAIFFLSDLKLGHYMKIPPRHMFTAQFVGTVIAGVVNTLVAYWVFSIMPDVCQKSQPEWRCRNAAVFYSASVIWGVIGPNRMFGSEGYYSSLNWWFLIGALAPVPFWLLSRRYPKVKWIQYINIPVLFAGIGGIPPAYTGSFPMWFLVGFVFQYWVYRYRQAWWARYNYILSAGLDAGVAITSLFIFFVFTNNGIEMPKWWGTQEDCPILADGF